MKVARATPARGATCQNRRPSAGASAVAYLAMGRQDISPDLEPAEFRAFTKALLNDLRALEHMLRDGMIETGVRRIGAEQELFLVDRGFRPAPIAVDLLEHLEGAEYTTELAKFNLEINLPPLELGGRCLTELQHQVQGHVDEVRRVAGDHKADVVLMGILPTLTNSDLSLENITPRPRYHALNDAVTRMCGGTYHLHIQGSEELHVEHDSVMMEAGNTSFQVHLQVEADEFAHFYNVAQMMAAPVLAASVNSPLLFGRRLWMETRIALFQQSIDTRRTMPHRRELTPRVRFGERWIEGSILDVYREDIARIPALVGATIDEDSLQTLRDGRVPRLAALQIYNGTVYRWNRPCYGVLHGKPHLRIECRVLPSGPTIQDEVANAAFWIGAVLGGAKAYDALCSRMDFADARGNLLAAARGGLQAGFTWMDGRRVTAPRLILAEIIPLARSGLEAQGVDSTDIDRYLSIIDARVRSKRTGARWLVESLARFDDSGTEAEQMAALTAAAAHRQHNTRPGHEWDYADIGEGGGWRHNYLRVEQYMTTDLFTVKQHELVDLTALLMDWKHIRQVPVEDDEHRLVGLVSYGAVLRVLATGGPAEGAKAFPVKDIMDTAPVTAAPDTPTLEAIQLMRSHGVTCLPIVKDERLVGIVSVDDFLPIVTRLLEERLEDK